MRHTPGPNRLARSPRLAARSSLRFRYTVPSQMTTETITHSAEETIAYGRQLAAELSPPRIVLLRGDLGAGKTTLVKGIAEGFEAARAEDVTSPTFTLVHEYRGPRATLYHIDLYRIETPRNLETLALVHKSPGPPPPPTPIGLSRYGPPANPKPPPPDDLTPPNPPPLIGGGK